MTDEVKTDTYTVKNGASGARGVGSKLVDAGATVEITLTEEEAVLLSDFEGVELEGVKAKATAKKTT